jgi:hypothetical protein
VAVNNLAGESVDLMQTATIFSRQVR